MILNQSDLSFCLDKAREISERYIAHPEAPAGPRRSMSVFLKVCQEYLPRPIVVNELTDHPVTSIRAYCLFFGYQFEIVLLSGMNNCWRRYALCKELFQVILDREADRTTHIHTHLEDVLTAFPSAQARGAPSTVSEMLAEFGAMEFLFPYADRERITNPMPDSLAIAERYKTPQVLVEEYMGLSYMTGLKGYMNVVPQSQVKGR